MKLRQISRTKRKIRIILLTVLSIVMIAATTIFLYIHSYINKINLVTSSTNLEDQELQDAQAITPETQTDDAQSEFEDVDKGIPDSPESGISSLEDEIQDNVKKSSNPVMYDKAVFNILLIGSDTRKEGGSGRSDVMILVSINKKTKKIIVTSFLRDIYLQIPDRQNNRINAAYAFGGADLLLDTMEQNFRIKVDQYASIDFYSFIDVVDSVGGVTIKVTEDELPVTNDFIRDLNQLTGQAINKDCLKKAGTNLLNGKQALAYSRNRYVGNGDFGRTQRQRKVLEQIYGKVKELNLLQLKDLLDVVLPQVTTNLTEGQILSLAVSLPTYMKYEIEQWSVPTSDSYQSLRIRGMAVLGIDFDKNISELYKRIYDKVLP